MPRYRKDLPQKSEDLFLSDGGLETTLIFQKGIDLPNLAAFELMESEDGREAIRSYFDDYLPLAVDYGTGFILESPTWRANRDWARNAGYSEHALREVNQASIDLLTGVRKRYENGRTRIVVSGCLGPRGDGYVPSRRMSAKEAEEYHLGQIETFQTTEADLVTALTLNYPEEAIGIARAARSAGMPVVLSFTVETDGNLPTGQSLGEAIDRVDSESDGAPAYYMINCSHPTHFEGTLGSQRPWVGRIRGIRANASSKSHAELEASSELDIGNPEELGGQYRELRDRLPHINVLGGCCGTDHRHIEAICKSVIGNRRD